MYRYLRLAAILIGVSVLFSCVFGSKLSLAETDADLEQEGLRGGMLSLS